MLLAFFNTEMADDPKLTEALNDKFISKEKFAEGVEALVKQTQMNYIDAIVEYCQVNGIEVESVSKLISKPLKERLRVDAMELNYIRKTTQAKLPL